MTSEPFSPEDQWAEDVARMLDEGCPNCDPADEVFNDFVGDDRDGYEVARDLLDDLPDYSWGDEDE